MSLRALGSFFRISRARAETYVRLPSFEPGSFERGSGACLYGLVAGVRVFISTLKIHDWNKLPEGGTVWGDCRGDGLGKETVWGRAYLSEGGLAALPPNPPPRASRGGLPPPPPPGPPPNPSLRASRGAPPPEPPGNPPGTPPNPPGNIQKRKIALDLLIG